MNRAMKRQLIHGIVSLVIGLIATWLINYLVQKLVGDDDDARTLTA